MALTQIRKEQLKDLTIDNSKIAENAAINYSKLNLSSSLVASDLNPSTDRVHDAVLDSKLIALWDVVTDQEVSGSSSEVTSKVTTAAQTDEPTNGSPQSKGVLLTGTGIGGEGITNYRVQIRNSDTKDPVCDNLDGAGFGGAVYGELRHDGTDYKLYYFKSDATSYSFNDAVQVTKINTVSDVSNSLDEAFFEIYSPTMDYLVWYNTSGVTGSGQPQVEDKTLIEVQINENESAGMIAKKTAIELNNTQYFQASVVEGTAEVTSIKTRANVNLNGKYFKISGIDSEGIKTDYVIWYGSEEGTILLGPDGVQVKVTVSGGETASEIATETQKEINLIENSPFIASANGDLITITCAYEGAVPNAHTHTSEFFITQLIEGKDPSSSIIVRNGSSGYCSVAHDGSSSSEFTFDLISAGVSKIDFMFVEIYSYYTAPLMSFVTGMGFADVVGVSGTHNHNDLYFSRIELSSGALDNRYYTETELNGGQLDVRYFTKNDLSISGSVSSNVLDARYFTKSQLASSANSDSGSKLIGVEPKGNLSSSNLQSALEEIQGDIDDIVSGNIDINHSLDDAYDDGSVISVDETDVDFQLSEDKKFIVSDSTDTKLSITAGSESDSVAIQTSGGIDVDAEGSINIARTNGPTISMTSDFEVTNSSGYLKIANSADSAAFVVSNNKVEVRSSNTSSDAVKMSSGGGVDVAAAGDIDITSSAGDIKFDDKNLTSSIPLSQSGVVALSTNFDTATSIIGAINENANDLNTLITVTLPSTSNGYSGADKIGVTGISGVIPTGKNLGDSATVQEMLEGIAIGAGGGKTFANTSAFTTAKANGTYFKVNEPVFILDINRWAIVKTQSENIIEGVDWDYVGDTSRVIGGGSFQTVLTDTTNDSFKVDTDGGISLTADGIINVQNATNSAKMQITSAGKIDIESAEEQDVNISSDNQIFVNGVGESSVVKIASGSIDIDTHTDGMTIDINANKNLVATTTGSGEIQLISSDEVKITGGDITATAGSGKSVSISSDTLVGVSSDTSILMSGGAITANAGSGEEISMNSDTEISLSGGNEIDLTANLIDVSGDVEMTGYQLRADMSIIDMNSIDGYINIVSSVDSGGFVVALLNSNEEEGIINPFGSTEDGESKDPGSNYNTKINIEASNSGNIYIHTENFGSVKIKSADNTSIIGPLDINGETTITAPTDEDIILITSGTGGVYLESEYEIELQSPLTKTTGNLVMPDDSWLSVGNIKITSVDPDDFATISGSRTGTINPLNLVKNSGFEEGSGSQAEGWTQASQSFRNSEDKYYGSFSVKTYLENNAGETDLDILTTTVEGLQENTNYNVSFFIKGVIQGELKVSLGSNSKTTVLSYSNHHSWTRINTVIETGSSLNDNFSIWVYGFGGYFNFNIDAIMVVEGQEAVEYFIDKKSELIFSIGDDDDDRIIMRSEGSTTKDLVRINQDTVEILGNLQVSGTTTTVNSEEMLISDNQIILNSNATGTASLDAFITVERGDDPNVSIKWNESTDTWELTNDGTNYSTIVTAGGSGSLSMDVAYDGGSVVDVDNTNVDFQLAASKKFIISDSSNENKFVVTAGSGYDSVKIDTTGGVDINANRISIQSFYNTFITTNKFDLLEQISIESNEVRVYSSSGANLLISGTTSELSSSHEEKITISSTGTTILSSATSINTGSFSALTSDDFDVTSQGDVNIEATSITIDATNISTTGSLVQTGNTQIKGDFDLDGDFDQSGNYTFKIDTSNTSTNSVRINTLGGIDIDAEGAFTLNANTITSVGTLAHTGSAAITGATTITGSLTTSGETVSITSTGTLGSHLTLTSADKIKVVGEGVEIDAGTGAFSIDGDSASSINVNGANLSFKTTDSGTIALDSAGAITFKDSLLSTEINLSQTNAAALSDKFDYDSQVAFDWTSRDTGQSPISSVIGALNANRQDLWEFVELLNTQGAAIGVAAGANLIGCDGIDSIIPNKPGASLGDDGTVQEMLEALALQAGGSCKHFATLQDFLDYKGGTGAYSGKPGYLASMTQVYIENIEREIRVLTAGTTGVIEGTDWDYLWGSERPFAGDEFVITSSSVLIDTTGSVSVSTDSGFSINDDGGSSFVLDSTGLTLDSNTEIELNSALIDINASSTTIDSALTITAPVNTNISATTTGTGKIGLNSASEVAINGGKLTLAAGANGDVVISTSAGSGIIDINAANAFEIDAGSTSYISVVGDFTLQSTVGDLYLDDSRTLPIPLSDSSNTTLPTGATSIIGAINQAYNRVGDTTFIEYEEHTVDSTDATNDYIVSNIGLLPIEGTFPMTPSTLRNGVKAFVSIYLNGLRLTDSEFRYTYQASERRITFDGSDNITLVAGDKLAIEVTKISSGQCQVNMELF